MGHLTVKNYKSLYRRMDQFVHSPFDSNEFYEILKILFTDEEAALCSIMPLIPSPCEKLAKIWDKSNDEAQSIIASLVNKGLVYEDEFNGLILYTLAIPIFGFFEFSLMRNDGKFDRKLMSELYHKYINEDSDFVKKYFGIDPPCSRIYVHEDSFSEEIVSEVLSYEKSTDVIENADCISVGTCFCRHKKEHAGEACDAPQDVCLSFGSIAKSLINEGIAREITKAEAFDILKLCIDHALVQIGDNIKSQTAIICNCCGCCCDLFHTYKKFGISTVISPSSYIAKIDSASCNNCGVCVERCPVDAISIINDKAVVDENWCLGCGVCSNFCKTKACRLHARPKKVHVPENTLQKVLIAAIKQAKVGNFLFDNQKSITHKILKNMINLLIKFPPVKWLLLKKSTQDMILSYAFKKNNIEDFNI